MTTTDPGSRAVAQLRHATKDFNIALDLTVNADGVVINPESVRLLVAELDAIRDPSVNRDTARNILRRGIPGNHVRVHAGDIGRLTMALTHASVEADRAVAIRAGLVPPNLSVAEALIITRMIHRTDRTNR